MQIATARIGLILVNLSPAYQRGELSHALALTGIKAVVTQVATPAPTAAAVNDSSSSQYGFLDIFRETVPEFQMASNATPRIQSESFPELEHVIGVTSDGSSRVPDGVVPFADLLRTSADERTLQELSQALDPDDPINIQVN